MLWLKYIGNLKISPEMHRYEGLYREFIILSDAFIFVITKVSLGIN